LQDVLAEALSGVVGLVDCRAADWPQQLASRSGKLTSAAVPGVADCLREVGEERWDPARIVRESGGLPILFGAAGIPVHGLEHSTGVLAYTDATIEESRRAASAGAVALFIPTPTALKPLAGQSTEALVYRYFRDVQAKAALPLVIYQPAGADASYRLTPDSILSLVRLGRVRGLVMEEGTYDDFEACVRAGRRASFAVLCGEQLVPQALEWGATGVAVPLLSKRFEEIAAQVKPSLATR
jgi:hypothetical protein